jgi:hypothetical protein
MRWFAGVGAVVAAALAVGPVPAGAAEPPRVTIAFLPVGDTEPRPLLERFARLRGAAVGMSSPTLGRYSRVQMLLDVSQGARVARSLYDEEVEAVSLRLRARGRRGRIDGWSAAAERARGAPGDLVPGLLAASVRRGARVVAYTREPRLANGEAAVAADRRGGVAPVVLEGLAPDFLELRGGVWVERLPPGPTGISGLSSLFRERLSEELVIAVAEPPSSDRALLVASAIAGPGIGAGVLRSDTTRRDGLVTATDIAPTVLRHLGLPVPEAMEGQPISVTAGDAAEVASLADRYEAVKERRGIVGAAVAAAWLLLAGSAWALRGRPGLRVAGRIVFLSALWIPSLALLAAALRPSAVVEAALLAAGSLALGALTDRLVRWPVAPTVPAAVGFAAYTADLAAGSPLTAGSLLGPDPVGGARFYGVGNELEIALSLMVVLGIGAALARARARAIRWGFAGGCLVAAAVLGAGRLGADVGAVITLAAGAVGAVAAAAPAARRRQVLLVGIFVPAVAVAALVALDALTGGEAHLGRSVVDAGGGSDLLDVVERRVLLSVHGLANPAVAVLAVAAAAALVWGVRNRGALLAPLEAPEGRGPRAALWGALAATVVGALANDSGPMILLFGTAVLGLALAYAHSRPDGTVVTDGTSPLSRMARCA